MGDMVWKRFKVIRGSLVFLPVAAVMLICIRGLLLAVHLHYSFWSMRDGAIFLAVVGSAVQLAVIGLVPFFANVIPFAMDQLRDLPSGDSSIFVYWYVWTIYAPPCIIYLIANSIYFVDWGIDQNKIVSETAIILISSIVFVWVAKGYKYRQRDEVSRVRQYAEEYYSNPQREPNYDYYSPSL